MMASVKKPRNGRRLSPSARRRDRLAMWGLTLLSWALIVVVVLAIGLAVWAIALSPPSLYSLVVIGVFLLAGIFWELIKLANKR